MRPLFGLIILAFTASVTAQTAQNVPMEIALHSQLPHSDPFNQVTVDVVFTDPNAYEWRVPAFWDGGCCLESPVFLSHSGHTSLSVHLQRPQGQGA